MCIRDSCYSYASLASGMVDIVIDPTMKIYDYAALVPIITMAGGIITNWQGENLTLQDNLFIGKKPATTNIIAAANHNLLSKALLLINEK